MNISDIKSFEGKSLSSIDSQLISPVTKWLNPKLISIDDKRMECELRIKPEMGDAIGIIHGGIRATILCDLLGIFANFSQNLPAISTSMNIDFIDKAPVGDDIKVVAEIVNKGSNLIYMTGEILNAKNKIVAKGSLSLFIMKRR